MHLHVHGTCTIYIVALITKDSLEPCSLAMTEPDTVSEEPSFSTADDDTLAKQSIDDQEAMSDSQHHYPRTPFQDHRGEHPQIERSSSLDDIRPMKHKVHTCTCTCGMFVVIV